MFWFRLALALGRPVGELKRTISSREFTQWLAFYRLDPFGGYRQDVHAGIIASTIANVNRSRKTKAFKVEDFVVGWNEPPKPKQSVQSMKANLMAAFKASGCEIIDKTGNNG